MTWTDKTWGFQESVESSELNQLRDNFRMLEQYNKMKLVDETVTASTTLQNDDDFFFSVAANTRWACELHLQVNTNTTADFKWNWTVPAGTTRDHTWAYNNPGAFPDWQGTADGSMTNSGTGNEAVHIYARFLVGGTAGTVQFQWAQQTSSGSTIVELGSYMHAFRCNG